MTMNALAEETSSLLERLREVPAPEPMISRQREKELTSCLLYTSPSPRDRG